MNLRYLFGRKQRERELEEELQAHLKMAVQDRMGRGEDEETARFSARREFGNQTLVQETARQMWGWRLMAEWWQDTRYAWRGMKRSPGFTATAILSLALGVGANTAIFSLINTVMLRFLPVRHPSELVELMQKYPGEPRGNGYWTRKSYEHYRTSNHVFTDLLGTSIDQRVRLRRKKSNDAADVAEYVTANYFHMLGVAAIVGRTFESDQQTASDPSVAVVSWSYWTGEFGRNPAVLGKQIYVQDRPVTIIGVAPPAFTGLLIEAQTDVWLPLPRSPAMGLALVGRLKPGTTLAQARAEMEVLYPFTIAERAAKSNDPQIRQLKIELARAGSGLSIIRDQYRKPLFVLMSLVGLLLLITCVNLASMLLARGAGRMREMSVRVGLGATHGRLIRQGLTEALLLSLMGTFAAIAIAYWGTELLIGIVTGGRQMARVHLQVEPDLQVLLFAAAVTVLTALLFGLAPALKAFEAAPISALRLLGGGQETRSRRFFGKILVGAQVALSVLLLSSAGLAIFHLWRLKHTDLGFRRDHVLLLTLNVSGRGYNQQRLSSSYRQLLERFRSLPGVESAALCAPSPLSGAGASGFANVEGFAERPAERRWIMIGWITPGYLETLETPLLAGRDFTSRENEDARAVIINQATARYYFAGRDPLGKRISLEHVTGEAKARTYEVVGVVGNAHYTEIQEEAPRTVYLAAFHDGRVSAQNFVLRTSMRPDNLANAARHAVQELLANVPVRFTTLENQIDATIVPERLMATLSGFFAGLAALLASVGIYGLLAYTVARRMNEIGVRLALGATRSTIMRIVLGDALTMVGMGLVIGVPLAAAGSRLTAALMPGMHMNLSWPLIGGTAVILIGALAASYIPARRAAHVDPVEALWRE